MKHWDGLRLYDFLLAVASLTVIVQAVAVVAVAVAVAAAVAAVDHPKP